MASIVVAGDTSGTVTLTAPLVAGTTTLTLPTANGTLITTGSSGQSIPKAALPTGSVLQVVSTTKTDTFTTSSTGWTSITGLSANITPTSNTSRILVIYSVCFGQTDSNGARGAGFRITRNGSAIGVADASGSRIQQGSWAEKSWEGCDIASQQFLDSPATTSSLTYQIQIDWEYGSFTACINRSGRFLNSSEPNQGNWVSTITVMEIAA